MQIELTFNEYLDCKDNFVGDWADDIERCSFIANLYHDEFTVKFVFRNLQELTACGKFIIETNNDEKAEMENLPESEHHKTDLEYFWLMETMIKNDQGEFMFNPNKYVIMPRQN